MVATPTIEWDFTCSKRSSTIQNTITPGTYDLTNHGPFSLAKATDLYCYHFDGVDDYLEDGAVFALSASSFTIEFFIEIDNTQTAYGNIVNRYGADASGWGVFYNAGTHLLELVAGANSVTTTLNTFTSKQRIHGVVTYDNTSHTTKWYIDGDLDKTDATTTLTVVDTSNLTVGRDSGAGGTNPFKGGIFFIRVYNATVLSAADARTRYVASAGYYEEFSFVNTPLYPATYRMWARNYDYSLRQPVWKWVTMDISLKYCDISTCILTMQTSDYLETWYDAAVTPVTERTWIQNYTGGGTGVGTHGFNPVGTDIRYLKGTGIVIYRNNDETPIFNGMITGFKSHKISDGEDTCEITFSSDEQLLLEHIAFPDILPGDGQFSGRVLPTSSTGIWGSTSGHSKYGSQWGTDYAALKDSQEAQMKYFVGDQIGAAAPATGTTNRKLSVLKVQDPWNYQDVNNVGYGDATLLTDILESLLDLCKYCVVPQPASDATVFSPRDEIRFFIRYLNPPVGAYYLEFCTQTATDATYRAAYAARFSGGGHNHADVGMGTHDKRETCVFSMQTGTVTELEYEELRPEVNQLFVIGPTPADTSNVTTTGLLQTDGHGAHGGFWPPNPGGAPAYSYDNWDTGTMDEADNAVMGASSAQAAQDVSVTTDIDRRMYKLVTGDPVTLSQDVYGVIESTFEHSTGEGMPTNGDTSKSETLKMMKFSGRSELNEKLFNIYYMATVRESDVLKMSPDEGMQNFFIGDYVSVITQYGTIQNLVREIHLSTDSNGEKLETVVGTPAAAYGNWWTAGNVAKRSRHHGHRTSRHHSHNTKSQT